MKDLYLKLRDIICENYVGELDNEALDIITVSSLALFMKNPELTLEKLPSIFNKLVIFAGDDKVSSFILKKYPNYVWNSSVDSEKAMVVRALSTDSKPVTEDWTMAISTTDISNRTLDVVSATVHELTHLLRFGGISETKREILIRDGVCFASFDKKKKKTSKDNYYFEEGIVEYYTKETMENFYTYLQTEEDLSFSPMLDSLKSNFNGLYKNGYAFEVALIEKLATNLRFKELIYESFEPCSGYPGLISYYNSIHRDHGAFSLLSNNLDRIAESSDVMSAKKIIDGIKPSILKVVEASKKI